MGLKMATLKAGKRPTALSHPGYENLAFSVEQLEKLETMKDKAFEDGVAKKSFVNHILLPDGTVTEDLKKMIREIKKRAKELMQEATNSLDDDEASSSPEDGGPPKIDLLMANARGVVAVGKEIQEHIDQKRFLFIVDEHFVPRVYFQCATDNNPDREIWKKAKKEK